jgi:DGQHR domain-containing protein
MVDLPRNSYEVDVAAEFEDLILLVECKTGTSNSVTDQINKITADKGDLQSKFRKITNTDKPSLFLIIYSENELSEANFKKAKKDKIDIWNEKIFAEYFSIAKQLKERARSLVFSDLLAQKKIKWGRKNRSYNCLVTKGTYKGFDCYNFQMSPSELLKIAYVHRRNYYNSVNTGETEVSYQRMINIRKIKNIQKYLEIPGNSFPTPILINFDKKLEFSPLPERNAEKRTGNVTPGWLSFPEEYGYAWIIDGQHRLFGYSGLDDIADSHMLNIIAFSEMDQIEQANLFVDINQNQKSIPADYLWDLYTDIYPEDDSRHKLAWLVKELNKSSNFFENQVYIPSTSIKTEKSYNLKINNIGVSFKNKISQVYKKLIEEDINNYYDILDLYFSTLIESNALLEDWEKGDSGFLCSNNGVGILSYILNNFHKYLVIKGRSTKIISKNQREQDLINFSTSIAKAIEEIGLEVLNEKKKNSSESGRKEVANDILMKAGEFDDAFKKMARSVFLTNKEEDLKTEFKETLIYNIKDDRRDNDLFEEAILGSICAFINRGIEGELYIGVRDEDKKLIGIDNELDQIFDGSFDKLKLFLSDQITDKLKTRNYPTNQIELKKYLEDPLVLLIKIPFIEGGVCTVKTGKTLRSWFKEDAKKILLSSVKGEENLKLYLKNRLNSYNSLMAEEYTNLQELKKKN